MLVLSRYQGERILIGNDVVIELVQIRGDKVRIGVTAPADVRVDREEVRLAIVSELGEQRQQNT